MPEPAFVIVTSSFPIRSDGSEAAGSFVHDIVMELSRHVPVRVVAPGQAKVVEKWSEKLEVFRFPAPDEALSTLRLWWPPDVLKVFRVLREGQSCVRQAVCDASVSHVLALWALPCGEWARSASKEFGIPYSVWALGSDIWTLGKIPLVRSRLRTVLTGAQACLADGVALAEDTRRIARRDVEFLPSTRSIQSTRTCPARGAPPYRLVYVGRWHGNKGVDLLLQALLALGDDVWSSIESVRIYGGGPLAPLLCRMVAELQGVDRPVEIGGYLTKAEAEAAILQADYLVIPSRIESIPVVLSDALKLRCPVICTPVGDMGQIVSQYGVGLVAAGVSAEKIGRAISDAVSGRHRFEQDSLDEAASVFDEKRIVGRLLHLLKEN